MASDTTITKFRCPACDGLETQDIGGGGRQCLDCGSGMGALAAESVTLHVLTLELDDDDYRAVKAELDLREGRVLPDGDSNAIGAHIGECVRDIADYRALADRYREAEQAARRFYHADGTFEVLESAEAVVARRVEYAAQREALLAACEAALAYIAQCVEPSCNEGDELEDGTIDDGTAPEGNMLRAAIAKAKAAP
jgi:hypothetical protein